MYIHFVHKHNYIIICNFEGGDLRKISVAQNKVVKSIKVIQLVLYDYNNYNNRKLSYYIVVIVEQQYNVNTLCTEHRYKHKCTQTLQYITTCMYNVCIMLCYQKVSTYIHHPFVDYVHTDLSMNNPDTHTNAHCLIYMYTV